MKDCTEIESLLLLNRAGERTAAEQALVDAHLVDCQACRVVLAEIVAFGSAMPEIREAITRKSETFDAADSVMKAIRQDDSGGQRRSNAGSFDALLEWLIPAVAVPVVALLLLFIVQESTDYSKIGLIEQRLKFSGKGTAGSMAITTPRSVADMHDALNGAAQYATTDERRLLAKSTDALAGLVSRGGSPALKTMSLFASNHLPVLASLISGQPVDPSRRHNLVAEGTLLLQHIGTLQSSTKGIQ